MSQQYTTKIKRNIDVELSSQAQLSVQNQYFVRPHYELSCWKDSEGNIYYDTINTSKNTTISAQWRGELLDVKYDIGYIFNTSISGKWTCTKGGDGYLIWDSSTNLFNGNIVLNSGLGTLTTLNYDTTNRCWIIYVAYDQFEFARINGNTTDVQVSFGEYLTIKWTRS